MKRLIKQILPFVDIFLVPLIFISGWVLKIIRTAGVQRLPFCRGTLLNIGVFPIRDHYHDPQFNFRDVQRPFSEERDLPGINWDVQNQLDLMQEFTFSAELENIPAEKTDETHFYLNNGSFESGDSEYWYQLIRAKKPKKIFEVGSGNSTLMAIKALCKNEKEDASYKCKHICIEPYEVPWLESTGVTVVREKIEDVDISFFSELGDGDILFIDSSHMVRPDGDVLFEYLQLLPTLAKGVIVHVHDIFSPRNYPANWLNENVRFWNEQYVLEAFLTHNTSWVILGSLNYLSHNNYEELKMVCPSLKRETEPGSFYLQKVV